MVGCARFARSPVLAATVLQGYRIWESKAEQNPIIFGTTGRRDAPIPGLFRQMRFPWTVLAATLRFENIPAILLDITFLGTSEMAGTAQKRAVRNYRSRMRKRGMTRFEVLGLDCDRQLVRSLAKRLSENDAAATKIRATVRRAVAGEPASKGGIFQALRRSPLVGADLDLSRSIMRGRRIDL